MTVQNRRASFVILMKTKGKNEHTDTDLTGKRIRREE
jgi:hypothetical protein